MKKFLLIALLLTCGAALPAQTCTPTNGMQCSPNLNLWIPPLNYYNWNIPNNLNWSLIDTASTNWVKLNALNTFTQNQTMPGLVITGCASGTYALADGTGCGNPTTNLPTCTVGQLAYYAAGGAVQACLNLGTGLSITGGTLNASASGGGINQLTGDGTAGPGTGSQALTLATVNAGPGSCGDATHVCQITTNGKGLTTTQTLVAITGASLTVVQKNCLSIACAGGSTYSSGGSYTNSSGVPVLEEVTMSGPGGGCTGSDFLMTSTVGGVTGPSAAISNACNGATSITFIVPVGASFSVTVAKTGGGASAPTLSNWLELSL
jgi:hypothetical protein